MQPIIKPETHATSALPSTGFIRLKQLIAPNGPVPFSRSTIWAMIRAGQFPAPVAISGRRLTAFRVDDIHAWIRNPKSFGGCDD